MAQIPAHLAIAPSRQVRLRYTGDGSAAVGGFPSDPDKPEFWHQVTDDELERLVATGLYEHIGDYDADADEKDAAARGPEKGA
jgi:hypothetical protein